jgi:hypothetical protein
MEIDKEKFESIVTAAACASVNVFNAMQDALDKAQQRVFCDVVPEEVIEAGSPALQDEVLRYVCLDAFYREIPQLDLVLTPTGFGVVSNQNVAPASRDRVVALQQAIRDERDDSLDCVITLLLGNKDWAGSLSAAKLVHSVMFLAEHLHDYAGMEGHRTELLAQRAKIAEAELRIMNVCSYEEYDILLLHIQHAACSDEENKVILSMRRAIGFYLNSLWGGFERELQYISNFLEGNLSSFTEYANSNIYRVKHFENYENKREDSTFFFG